MKYFLLVILTLFQGQIETAKADSPPPTGTPTFSEGIKNDYQKYDEAMSKVGGGDTALLMSILGPLQLALPGLKIVLNTLTFNHVKNGIIDCGVVSVASTAMMVASLTSLIMRFYNMIQEFLDSQKVILELTALLKANKAYAINLESIREPQGCTLTDDQKAVIAKLACPTFQTAGCETAATNTYCTGATGLILGTKTDCMPNPPDVADANGAIKNCAIQPYLSYTHNALSGLAHENTKHDIQFEIIDSDFFYLQQMIMLNHTSQYLYNEQKANIIDLGSSLLDLILAVTEMAFANSPVLCPSNPAAPLKL
jgi:hypothetical protein